MKQQTPEKRNTQMREEPGINKQKRMSSEPRDSMKLHELKPVDMDSIARVETDLKGSQQIWIELN